MACGFGEHRWHCEAYQDWGYYLENPVWFPVSPGRDNAPRALHRSCTPPTSLFLIATDHLILISLPPGIPALPCFPAHPRLLTQSPPSPLLPPSRPSLLPLRRNEEGDGGDRGCVGRGEGDEDSDEYAEMADEGHCYADRAKG